MLKVAFYTEKGNKRFGLLRMPLRGGKTTKKNRLEHTDSKKFAYILKFFKKKIDCNILL